MRLSNEPCSYTSYSTLIIYSLIQFPASFYPFSLLQEPLLHSHNLRHIQLQKFSMNAMVLKICNVEINSRGDIEPIFVGAVPGNFQ